MSELDEHRTWALVDDAGFLDEVLEGLTLLEAVGEVEERTGETVVFDSVYEPLNAPKRAAKALAARRFLVPCWVASDGAVVAAETPRAAEAFWFGEEE